MLKNPQKVEPPPGGGEGQKGAALPFVLVVTMALVVIVSDLGLRSHLSFDRSRRALRLAEARGLVNMIEDGMASLKDAEMEFLASEEHEFPVDDFTVRLIVVPVETKININRLHDLTLGAPIQELFSTLLKRQEFEHRATACALDWVDADNDPRAYGAERLDYVGEDAVPRNAPFETVDELSFVRGFRDASAFERIRPLLTSFGSGKIYVPAASDEMLDLFEDVYGIIVRNSLEDMRRHPGRTLQLATGVISPEKMSSLQYLIASRPGTWQISLIVRSRNFYTRMEYVLNMGDPDAGALSRLRRIG